MRKVTLTISRQLMWTNRSQTCRHLVYKLVYKCCDQSEPGMGVCGLGETPLESVQSFFASHPEHDIELNISFIDGSQ